MSVRSRGLRSVTLGGAGGGTKLEDSADAAEVALDVPFFSQRSLPEAIAGRTCCPTSLTMVLAFHGIRRPLADVAEAVWDPVHEIYGSWLRTAAVATAAGCPAVVRQARSWSAVAGWLRNSGPVIASISYGTGELRGAVMPKTDGHLVVITGLDGCGGVLVHDPAGRRAQIVCSMQPPLLARGAAYRSWSPRRGPSPESSQNAHGPRISASITLGHGTRERPHRRSPDPLRRHHLRRPAAAAKLQRLHPQRGRHLSPAHAEPHAERAAGVGADGHRDRVAAGHRPRPGGRPGRHPQEPLGGGPGPRGHQGEALRQRRHPRSARAAAGRESE